MMSGQKRIVPVDERFELIDDKALQEKNRWT